MARSAPRPPRRPPRRPHVGRPPSPTGLPGRLSSSASLLAVLVALLLCADRLGAQFTCGPGLNTPGITIPQGDIVLEEGQELELFCMLNLTHSGTRGRNASHLAFYRGNRTVGSEYLTVVNETTLRLTMRPEVSSDMYYCKLNPLADAPEEVICLNNVAVGYQPQNVSEFSCISQNWQNLTCTWKKRPNPVKTRYTIWYRLGGRAGGRTKYACPEESDILEDKCTWSETSNPPYRLPYENYYFSLEGSNHFNNSTFQYRLNNYAHVIPAKAEKLKVREKTAYSALIEWTIPYPMQNFPPGLVHRIEYLPQWEAREAWQRVSTDHFDSKGPKHELNITSLKYANTLYDIRVYLKSKKADERDDSLWSAPAAVTVRTRPDLPGAPPRTDIGSFEIYNLVNSRDIYLFWQTIPDYLQNGDDFNYKILDVEENGRTVELVPAELTKKYAKFSKVGLDRSLLFSIVSSNTVGQSLNKSKIHIPPRSEVPPGPVSVTKVFYENGMYELSWKPPTTGEENISSYTIFWCDSISDHSCSGYLNWTRVPSDVTIRNMTVEDDKPYQFAVSANTDVASSGMVWALCTILYNKPIQRMKGVWVKRVGSTFMELAWKFDCFDRNGLVVGFRVYYCPVQHKGPECKGDRQNVTINDPQQSSATLTGLRPYTTYSVSVAVLSNGGESVPSEDLFNVTLEAAPTPPQHVSILNITNTSITIEWNPPEERNGVITKYEVHYDGKVQTKNNDNNNNNKQTLVLENLTSYYNYSISVAACTTACSDQSPPLTAETKVGEPGIVSAPHVFFLNQSLLSVNWDPPARPSGLLDYYEISISYPESGNATDELLTTSNTSHIVRITGCSETHHPYSFAVRAVNVDPNTNKTFRGPWSIPGEGSCYTSDLSVFIKGVIYLLSILGILIVSGAIGYSGKWLWYKCKDMRDVEVKLPPGIVLPLQPDTDQDFKMHQWLNHNHHDTKPPHGLGAAADEERLLQQKDDRHHHRCHDRSGDSSGCSSGHESVSSSATDGTHISSDSGTEVDRSEQGFSDPAWEAGSDSGSVGRRQRHASKGGPGHAWDDAYAYVGAHATHGAPPGKAGKGANVRSTPNLTDMEPAYTVMSLASWASSGSIPDKAGAVVHAAHAAVVGPGYVPLDAALSLAPPKQAKQQQGYVAHPPSSLLWERPDGGGGAVPKGYVQTGTASDRGAFTPECEGSWEEPLRLQQALSGGHVKAGESGVRPSRTEPALGTLASIMSGGYVMTGEGGLPLGMPGPARPDAARPPDGRLKPEPLALPLPLPPPAQHGAGPGQGHEYVLTGERPRPPLHLDQPKAYCRVSERPATATATAAASAASSGYVPHRHMEAPRAATAE